MAFDLRRAVRRIGPQRRTAPLPRRPDQELPFVDDAPPVGPPLLLDSTVYIDVLQGRAPRAVDTLVELRPCRHSAVCLAELTHAFGRLDPRHPGTATALRALQAVLGAIPAHRLTAPDVAIWGEAGVLGGLLFRLGGHAKGAEHRCLNDALIYLQARQQGCVLLSANIGDFDRLQQLVPDGRVLFYRRRTGDLDVARRSD